MCDTSDFSAILNAQDKDGWIPLQLALEMGRLSKAEKLLELNPGEKYKHYMWQV